jgi:cyclomaltodextrinase
VPRLARLHDWIDHWRTLGVTALYLGPLFESSTHGYDTTDYFRVDRRLGDDDTLAALVAECHRRGIRVILDGWGRVLAVE